MGIFPITECECCSDPISIPRRGVFKVICPRLMALQGAVTSFGADVFEAPHPALLSMALFCLICCRLPRGTPQGPRPNSGGFVPTVRWFYLLSKTPFFFNWNTGLHFYWSVQPPVRHEIHAGLQSSPSETYGLPVRSENQCSSSKPITARLVFLSQGGDFAFKAFVVSLNMSLSLDQIYQAVWVPYAGNRPVFPPVLERLPVCWGCWPDRSVLHSAQQIGCVICVCAPMRTPAWPSRRCDGLSPRWVCVWISLWSVPWGRGEDNNSSILYAKT